MNEPNPYVEARREWNDRYLDLARERRLWQIVAGVALVALLVVAGGFVWLSLQHKTVPYIVEVDSLDAAWRSNPLRTERIPPTSTSCAVVNDRDFHGPPSRVEGRL